ncbi:MAG: helix-turn-helix domain-containing protein [Monoglobus pectinilyticus]
MDAFNINGVQPAMNEHAQLQTLEHKNETNEREKFIRKLLMGNSDFNPKTAAELGIKFGENNFSVILVRINKTEDLTISDLPSIIFAIRNIGEELYGESSECYGVETDGVTVAFLLNHGSDTKFISEQSADLKRHIVELFGVNTTLSLCTQKDCPVSDCQILYNKAKYAMLYRLSFKPYSIIDYDKTLSMSRLSCEYPSLLEREIFECIHARNEEVLDRAISAFIGTVDKMSYDTIVLHTARLLIAVDNLTIDSSGNNSVVHNSVIEDLSTLESIDDLTRFIKSRCMEIMDIISAQKPDTKKDMIVTNIINYINDNYKDPELSVEAIAANVNRSSNYIRSIFKKSQGVSISEYLAQKRFDQVCKMLIETNLTAMDIGRAVGLNSGSYFYTSFKKYTGCTPDSYRKAHQAKIFDNK